MDFTNIWQEHRTFITLVVAGLLFFFVGQNVISGVYGIDEKRSTVRNMSTSLKRRSAPTTGQLEDARILSEKLRGLHESTVEKICFIPDSRYILTGDEKPDIQYDRLYNEARNTLVEGAKTLNITVARNIGMPELSPTRKSEIQRALTALDIVTRVVLLAIESQIRIIDSINMVPDAGRRKKSFLREQRIRFKMQGSTAAVSGFMKRFAIQENFLAIEEAEFSMVDKDGVAVSADFTVSAITIIEEEPES